MATSKVNELFESIHDDIQSIIEIVNHEGAKFFEKGDYAKAKELMEKGSRLKELQDGFSVLRSEWLNTFGDTSKDNQERRKTSKRTKIKGGLRTHENEYRIPILQALVELGGSSNLQPVIDRVGEIMKPILNKYDYMPLKSDPKTPKWRNTTQWVRFQLVQEGYMAADSPIGTWEITSKGRQWLEQELNIQK